MKTKIYKNKKNLINDKNRDDFNSYNFIYNKYIKNKNYYYNEEKINSFEHFINYLGVHNINIKLDRNNNDIYICGIYIIDFDKYKKEVIILKQK